MVEVSRLPAGNALGFSFSKEVSERDLDIVIEEIDCALNAQDRINILCDMVDFECLTPKAFLKDLIYGLGSLGRIYRFERVALVADSDMLKGLAELESHMFPGLKLQTFHSQERQAALGWVQQPIIKTPTGMILSEIESANCIRVKVEDMVTGHDVRRLCQAIRYRYESRGPANLLVQLESRPIIGPGLLYEKLRAFEVLSMIGKYAVVAPSWARARVDALSAIFSTRMRYFPSGEEKAALEWLADETPSVYIYPLVRGHMITMRLVGKLTDREVKQLYYLLMPHLDHDGGIDLLLEVPYDEGMTLKGILKAVQMGVHHFSEVRRAIRRVAVLTDTRWISRAVGLENMLLPKIEERAFTFAQRSVAEAWLNEGRESPQDREAHENIAAWDAELA